MPKNTRQRMFNQVGRGVRGLARGLPYIKKGVGLYKKYSAKNGKRKFNKKAKKSSDSMPLPRAIKNGSGITRSFHSINYKPTKMGKMAKYMLEPSTYEQIDTRGVQSVIGTQGTTFGFQIGYGKATGMNIDGPSMISVFNAAQTNATGGYLTGQQYIGGNDNAGYKMFLDSVETDINITSQAQCDAFISIYTLMSKNTADDSQTPEADWSNGLTSQTVGIGAAGTTQFPGAVPTTSKEFNIRWKVVHEQKLMMGSGASHIHTTKIKYGRLVDMEYFDSHVTVKGITYCHMIVWRGQPVDDGTLNNITTAPVKLIFLKKIKYKTRLVSPSQRNYKQVDNQEIGLTKALFMDQDGGGIADLLVAAIPDAGGPA